MSDVRYCLVCGASDEEVGDTGLSVCPLEDEDISNWWTPTWAELNCLEMLLFKEPAA